MWLVGNSMGGALAIDAALEAPERFAGLVLIGPGVSSDVAGWEEPPHDGRRGRDGGDVGGGGRDDLDARLELDAWLWLDGPEQRGRVGGAARELAIDMNRRVFEHGAPDEAGPTASTAAAGSASSRCRSRSRGASCENSEQFAICELLVERIPGARRVILPGTAHLPGLDAPEALVAAIIEASAAGRTAAG